MRVLAIESSCDETAAAIVTDGQIIESNIVASQSELHAKYGGIVPEVAARAHLQSIIPVVRQSLTDAHVEWGDLDAIAATRGPGLPSALVVGFGVARGLAFGLGLPLIPVDHIEGHVMANWLIQNQTLDLPDLPAVALVVSGGHTELLLVEDGPVFKRLGGTRDDAAGEAFDKVARLLGLSYPGGPEVSRAASNAAVRKMHFPRAWLRGTDDFSFSGLKTAVYRSVEELQNPDINEIAWAFQESVVDVLSKKAIHVAEREGARSLLLAGGVAANMRLREIVQERSTVPVYIPPPFLCTDNAAMIAAAVRIEMAIDPNRLIDIDPTPYRSRVQKIG